MVNRVNAAFDDIKAAENTGGTENSRGLEHLMSTAENTGESLMPKPAPAGYMRGRNHRRFRHLRDG